MAPSLSFSLLAFLLLLRFSSATDNDEVMAEFGYSGENGPDKWGSLYKDYSTCSSGKMQSPINISKEQTLYNKNLGSLVRDYNSSNATLVNHLFNIGIQFDEKPGEMAVDGKNYTLKQMHWHTPSEHQLDGVRYAAELHLVHQAADGSIAVVGILFEYGDEDSIVSEIKGKLDELAKEKCGSDEVAQIPLGKMDNKEIKKKTRKYYRYMGSLTTPPCTENVTWTILGKVRSISKEQVEALKAPLDIDYKNNSRPVQALNGRQVQFFHELLD